MNSLNLRVGIGHDTHRLEPAGRSVGRRFGAARTHAVGHSDADALLHAVIDALLGAASMGDIGELFPDTDPTHKGRDSADMLATVCERLRAHDWRIVNVDCIVFLERPKLGHYKDAMRMRIAELLEIPAHNVGSESQDRRRGRCRWARRSGRRAMRGADRTNGTAGDRLESAMRRLTALTQLIVPDH